MKYFLCLTAFLLCFSPFSNAETPKTEKSLIIKSSINHSDPQLPDVDAEVWVWGEYVADRWNGYDSDGILTETFKDRRTSDGSPIDIVSCKYKPICNSFTPCKVVWEVRRAYDWQRAIGRAAKIKGLTASKYAGIILITDNFNKDQEYILNARIACDSIGFCFRTVDQQGMIR